MALPPQSAPKFGRRMTDQSRPLSSWIKFQLRMLKYGYPKWENLIILTVFVFAIVLALSYAAEPGSVRLALRDWLEALWLKAAAP